MSNDTEAETETETADAQNTSLVVSELAGRPRDTLLALYYLDKQPGRVFAKDIVQRVEEECAYGCLSHGTIYPVLNDIEDCGWITRTQDLDDPRSEYIELTDTGRDAIGQFLRSQIVLALGEVAVDGG